MRQGHVSRFTSHVSRPMNIIGIDVGGTKILGVRADESGKIADQVLEPTLGSKGVEAVIDRIADIIRRLTPGDGADAIGVGMPGPLNPDKGEVYSPPNLPGWGTVPLASELAKRLKLSNGTPIVLVNDANAAALAEFKFGAGAGKKDLRHLVYLTISTGIGGGVISNGRMLLGSMGLAAELGHMVIDVNGPRCYCGGIGCFEAFASGTALAREAEVLVASRRETAMSKAVNGDPSKVTAEVVVKAAQAGDPVALELMEREGLLVGVGVVNCIHAFNPQLVVLGGGVTNAGNLLFDPVKATVEARIIPAYKGTFEIVPAALRGNSGALGAVAAALEATNDE
jgi:glucokinase